MKTHSDVTQIGARLSALVGAPLLLAACGGGDAADRPRASVRDSAGVVIVQNAAPAEEARDTLGDNPAWAVGVLEGAPEYQMYEVRGATRLSDGRLAVLNSGTKEVRFYSADGEYLSASGGDGEGPGEFREMGELYRLPGDSLLVYDWRLRRLSLLDPQGAFVRSIAVPMPEGVFPFPAGMLNEDQIAMRLGRMFGGDREIQDGVVQDTARYAKLNWRGDSVSLGEPFVELFGGETYVAHGGSNGNRWISMMNILLAASPTTVFHGGRIYYTPADRYEVRVMDGTGRLERIIRREHEPVAVTAAMHDAAVERNLEGIDDENWRKRRRTMIEDMPVPEFLPAIQRLRVDDAGRIWTQRYAELPDEPRTWDVFSAEGEWLTSVRTPPRFNPLEIGQDYLIGVLRDELDVEQVRLYELTTLVPTELASR